jgi:hypothetical protein
MFVKVDWIVLFMKLSPEQIRERKLQDIAGKQIKNPYLLLKNILKIFLNLKIITWNLITQKENIWTLIWILEKCSTYILNIMKKTTYPILMNGYIEKNLNEEFNLHCHHPRKHTFQNSDMLNLKIKAYTMN